MSEHQPVPNDNESGNRLLSDLQLKEELAGVSKKLSLFIDDAKEQKKRDGWDKLQILASFVSSILFAGVGLYFTTLYNDREARRQDIAMKEQSERAKREETRQAEMQIIQKQITQLEAIRELTPLLASKDKETKRYALLTLQALHENKVPVLYIENTDNSKPSAGSIEPAIANKSSIVSNQQSPLSLLESFAQMALTENASFEERKDALKKMRDIAINPKWPEKVKEKAIGIITNIATTETVPENVREIATDYLKDIISIPGALIEEHINKQVVSRNVNEILLHHTYIPAIKNYKGSQTIKGLVTHHVQNLNWKYAAWHYMVSPDGLIWTGRPLDVNWSGVGRGYHNQAISVILFLNGDEELPTAEQKESLNKLLNLLCQKFKIDPKLNFSRNSGFHRDHGNAKLTGKTCPGKLISKEMVLEWMNIPVGNSVVSADESNKLGSDQRKAGNIKKTVAFQGEVASLTKGELLHSLKLLISAKIEVGINEIAMESSFTGDLGADEMDFVELIMAVEEKFNVTIEDDEAMKMTTFGSMYNYLIKKLKLVR